MIDRPPCNFWAIFVSQTQGGNYTAEISLMIDIFSEKGIQFYTNYKVCRDPY